MAYRPRKKSTSSTRYESGALTSVGLNLIENWPLKLMVESGAGVLTAEEVELLETWRSLTKQLVLAGVFFVSRPTSSGEAKLKPI
jgi:hypothetical protein